MATPTPSPAEAPPAKAGDVSASSWTNPEAIKDDRQNFIPKDSLYMNFGSEGSGFIQGDSIPTEGFSGIKVDGLEDGPVTARGNLNDSAPVYLIFLIGAVIFYVIWRLVTRSGRANFAGQDGNR